MSHQYKLFDKLLLAELPDPNIELYFQKHLIRPRIIDSHIVDDHRLKGFKPPPVTFSINQESRNETRNHYVDTGNMIFSKECPEVLIEGLYSAANGASLLPHYTFFDPLVDTLRFRNTTFHDLVFSSSVAQVCASARSIAISGDLDILCSFRTLVLPDEEIQNKERRQALVDRLGSFSALEH